jgi:hypothetical protein
VDTHQLVAVAQSGASYMEGELLETFLYHSLKHQKKYLHDKKCFFPDKGKVLTTNTYIF